MTNQDLFLKGAFPNPLPDGFFLGSVPEHKSTWLGKKFNAANATGINLFTQRGGNTAELYPFKTYKAKGLKDKNLDVLAIDYNIPSNPFWLRLVLDEIVEVAPGQYLGKLQLRIIPTLPFTLIFFELKKEL